MLQPFKSLCCRRRRCEICLDRNEGQLVGYMPCQNRRDPLHGLGNLVNPKRLLLLPVCRDSKDDPFFQDILIMDAADRIGHLQLEGPVSFFCHRAGDRIVEPAEAV